MSDTENSLISTQEDSSQQCEEALASTATTSQTETASSVETTYAPNIHTGDDVSQEDEKPEHREHTRSKMALLFVLGFFSILFLCIAYAAKVGATLNELKDILVAIIGALSGTLGFIVGFYYKSIKEQ